jgi:hypothetical protein
MTQPEQAHAHAPTLTHGRYTFGVYDPQGTVGSWQPTPWLPPLIPMDGSAVLSDKQVRRRPKPPTLNKLNPNPVRYFTPPSPSLIPPAHPPPPVAYSGAGLLLLLAGEW